MDAKGKERGILKESRLRPHVQDLRVELTPPQGWWERSPTSPQPSVDRLSVTWADPDPVSMTSASLHHPPSEPVSEAKLSTAGAGEGSEDEDYSAVLRQRRASVRRSRKGRARRASSPFLADERPRRRSSVFTTSSQDTAISMEECPPVVTQEQIYENIRLHKEVLTSVKQQPLGMRRKLKLVHQAKNYVKKHEGQLQERLAQSNCTRDIYARFNIILSTKWQQMKREAANTSNLLIPWELRIKEIESHFGSVVASYFTFLRWLFWVNLVIAFILLVFVIVPEYLTANPLQDGERKIIMADELRNATNLLTLWEFEGVLKFSPIFYGYYSNLERPQYRMPLAYFLTGLVVYIYSFVAILRKMAENSRMSKLSEKDDECIFSWKLFTGWDFMIGNAETAHNRIASVILGFKEALLEEAEKKKDLRNWRVISLRALVNICVLILLIMSAWAVVAVVSRSDEKSKVRSWWRENETTIVVSVISITFPVLFEFLGFLEHYHPRKQLRLQLGRIMVLNLLNLYSLIFALFSKIDGMSKELTSLKPTLSMNGSIVINSTLIINETLALDVPKVCFEDRIPCTPCDVPISALTSDTTVAQFTTTPMMNKVQIMMASNVKPKTQVPPSIVANLIENTTTITSTTMKKLMLQNLMDEIDDEDPTTIDPNIVQLAKIREQFNFSSDSSEYSSESTEDTEEYNDKENNTHSTENEESYSTQTIINTYYTESYTTNNEITDMSNLDSMYTTIESDTPASDYNITTDSFFNDSTINNDITTNEDDITTGSEFSSIDTAFTSQFDDTTMFSEATTSSESLVSDTTSILDEISSPYSTSPERFTIMQTKGTENINDVDSTPTYQESDSTITSEVSTITLGTSMCPNITFNCSITCDGRNVTQVYFISNCKIVEKQCYTRVCRVQHLNKNKTMVDLVYTDEHKRKMYNLTVATKKKLLKLCWETMFGQELVKLTMMDLVFVLLGTLFMDFFRALFVRFMNRCWCWDLEKKFPEYGDFKIAENILHLINNQGMVWMGMFFSPGLVVLNVSKLMIMMYLRSWAVMTCNVPHEVVFRVSKSNNFYLALLLTMLFLCVLPVGYSIVWVKPSWHCGPFSEYEKIYYILTSNIYKILPEGMTFALEYIASPAIVIPLLVLLILIIYYLTSLTNSLREANNDLKIQLRRERTEERRKMFQLADTRRAGSSALDNTPFARWKKALPALPLNKSIDSDDRKTISGEDGGEPVKAAKKKGGLLAKIVGLALDKKPTEATEEPPASPNTINDETDSEFHETLPKEILKLKDIIIKTDKKKNNVEFKAEIHATKRLNDKLKVIVNEHVQSEKRPDITSDVNDKKEFSPIVEDAKETEGKLERNETFDSTHSKQSDSFGSVIPVIMISTTESDDEVLSKKGTEDSKKEDEDKDKKRKKSKSFEPKPLRRQSSVDSATELKSPKESKTEGAHKYQYTL